MVERGQPWRCITEGTLDDTRRCEQCRQDMRDLNEAIFAKDLD